MKLRPEYEKISDRVLKRWNDGEIGKFQDAIREAVERCQELADKPPKELTDVEIGKILISPDRPRETTNFELARAIIAAHIAAMQSGK